MLFVSKKLCVTAFLLQREIIIMTIICPSRLHQAHGSLYMNYSRRLPLHTPSSRHLHSTHLYLHHVRPKLLETVRIRVCQCISTTFSTSPYWSLNMFDVRYYLFNFFFAIGKRLHKICSLLYRVFCKYRDRLLSTFKMIPIVLGLYNFSSDNRR